MLIFGLCSTSDDQPSNWSNKNCPKCKKMATKLSKNEILNFALCSTSDDWLSNLSDKSCTKCKKKKMVKMFMAKLMSPPPNEKVGNLAKKIYGRFGMTKI